MKKHIFAMAVVTLAAGSAFAQAGDTLAKIKSSGSVTLGVRESSGLSYTLGNGKYVGFHTEMAEHIISDIRKQLGLAALETKYQPVTSQNRIPLVTNGTVDLECGSTTNNATRQKDVAFAVTTYVEEVRMVVKANSGIASIKDLNGKSVATTTGTTSVQTLRKNERAGGIDFKEVYGKDHADSFLLLETGRADAFVMDGSILAGNIANGSPIGDSMPCLMALGTTLTLRRGDKTRTVALDQFYTGQKQTVLQAGEFIEAVVLPKPQAGQVFRAHKVSKRFEQDISATCAAITYTLKGGKLSNVKLAYNGLAPSPCRAPKLEAVLEGKAPADVKASDLDAAIAASFVARDGLRATWAYRALVARNLALEFIEEQKEVA